MESTIGSRHRSRVYDLGVSILELGSGFRFWDLGRHLHVQIGCKRCRV